MQQYDIPGSVHEEDVPFLNELLEREGGVVYAVIYDLEGNVPLNPDLSNGCYACRQGKELVHCPKKRGPETESAESGRQVACMAFYGRVEVLLEYLRGLEGKVRVLPRCGGTGQPSCYDPI